MQGMALRTLLLPVKVSQGCFGHDPLAAACNMTMVTWGQGLLCLHATMK